MYEHILINPTNASLLYIILNTNYLWLLDVEKYNNCITNTLYGDQGHITIFNKSDYRSVYVNKC